MAAGPVISPDDYDPSSGEWVDCWQCGGEGLIDGECTCMDDTCCCLEPEPPECDICKGAGGWTATPPAKEIGDAA